jgi:hypothetical protein
MGDHFVRRGRLCEKDSRKKREAPNVRCLQSCSVFHRKENPVGYRNVTDKLHQSADGAHPVVASFYIWDLYGRVCTFTLNRGPAFIS